MAGVTLYSELNNVSSRVINYMKLLWQQIPSPIITEIFCNSGFDGVVFDLEHGCFNNETLYSCIQVCNLCQKKSNDSGFSFIRVSHLDKQVIRMALDAGISGIILSTVETEDQAQEFYDYCTYPYKLRKEQFAQDDQGIVRRKYVIEEGGKRGQGLVRENKWGKEEFALRKPILIPQIETIRGVNNLNDIKKLNFDYYLVGPYDLSASIGKVGDLECDEFKSVINSIKEIVGNKIGIHIPSHIESEYPKYNDYGFLALGMDTTFLVKCVEDADVL